MSYHCMEQNKYKKSIKKLGKISIYEFRKSKTSFAHSLVLNITDKMDSQRDDGHAVLWKIRIHCA